MRNFSDCGMRSEVVETGFEAKKVRRTKLIWMEDVENDLRGLKVNRWRQKVNGGKQCYVA
jgi:hypothetical protein